MKKLTATVAAVVAVLALAGCAGSNASVGSAPAESTVEAAPSAAPITMEPSASPSSVPALSDVDFVRVVSEAWRGEVPADQSLVAAGHLACDQLTSGTAESDVIVVEGEGEDAAWNNSRIVGYAMQAYCPELG